MKLFLAVLVMLCCCLPAMADDSNFSTHLYPKFQVKGCTACHDFYEKEREGIAFGSHQGRSPDTCIFCHTEKVTGFSHADDWFAQPGLYTSGMNPQQTCEAVRAALHADFKNKSLMARQVKKHLLEDPRVLWGIEGATPNSGMLPMGQKETDLVKGGLAEWQKQVQAWIDGGMKCE